MKVHIKFYFIFFVLFLCQCTEDKLKVDVEAVEVDITTHRLEKELFDYSKTNIDELNRHLINKYGDLYEIFVSEMIGEGSVHDPSVGTRIERFRKDSIIQLINDAVTKEFGDFTNYTADFEKAFKHYRFYFPDSVVPNIITFYSNFNAKIFPANNVLAIGLEMYLGSENDYVKQIPLDVLPQFIKDDMNKKFLVADGMKYWLLNRFYEDNIGDDFVAKVIELGKIMYLLDAMLPDVSDDIKINYSPEELKWVQEHEENIWKILVDEEVLYTKNPVVINQYIVDGPFTKGLPDESPSKVGVWVGWQIVRDYVNESNIDVKTLLKEKNNLKILRAYKHGKR